MVFLERFIELLVDLVSQLPTRRFFRPLLLDKHFGVRCRLAKAAGRPEARCFNQLLDILK